jgi:hypothetical protein
VTFSGSRPSRLSLMDISYLIVLPASTVSSSPVT